MTTPAKDAATARPWAELIQDLRAHNAVAITQAEHDAALRLAEAVLALPKTSYAWEKRLVELATEFQRLAEEGQ